MNKDEIAVDSATLCQARGLRRMPNAETLTSLLGKLDFQTKRLLEEGIAWRIGLKFPDSIVCPFRSCRNGSRCCFLAACIA